MFKAQWTNRIRFGCMFVAGMMAVSNLMAAGAWTLDIDEGTLTRSDGLVLGVVFSGATFSIYGVDDFSLANYTLDNIPDTIDGYTLTAIDNFAFWGNSRLAIITIPSSVTNIDYYAFSECSGLTSVTISGNLSTIGYAAFSRCTALTELTILEGVASVGNAAFSGCTALKELTIFEGVSSIGDGAFNECSSLTSVTIPASVTTIGDGVFAEGYGMFAINVDSGNPNYASEAGILYNKGMTELLSCPSGKIGSVTPPESLVTIGDDAFANCSGLTSITIPGSVTSIGDYAFEYCSGLTSITIPEGVADIGYSVFEGCSSLTSVTLPEGVVSIGDSAFRRCRGLLSVTIPDSMETLGDRAFAYCVGLTSVTIPASVTAIGDGVFEGCIGLTAINVDSGNLNYTSEAGILYNKGMTELLACPSGKIGSITLPEGLVTIGNAAFAGCSGLTSLSLPNSVISIGEEAFGECSALTSLTIPADVTMIGDYAFQYCSALTSVTIPGGVTDIGYSVFEGCSGLTSVVIPEGVDAIGENAFFGCSGLTSIAIPGSVIYIGDSAFYGCSGLVSVVIPEGVAAIGNGAFAECVRLTAINVDSGNLNYASEAGILYNKGMTVLLVCPRGKTGSVTIPSSVATISECAFMSCHGLTSVTIPEGVTDIGSSTFYDCINLTSVVLPTSVTTIGSSAFDGCVSLASITLPANVTDIGHSAFYGCSALASITFPASVTDINQYAFYGCSGLTSIIIPASVTYIGYCAFADCTGLLSITVDGGNPSYTNDMGVLYNQDMTELLVYPAGKTGSFTIPASVTTIGDYAFYACSDLASITVPAGVTSIGYCAFASCAGLLSINVESGNLDYTSEAGILYNKDMTALLACPAGKSGSLAIPEGVVIAAYSAFYGCVNLTAIDIPESMDSVPYFGDCSGLAAINVASANPRYASRDGVLYNKTMTQLLRCPPGKVGHVDIAEGVTWLDEYDAFWYCSRITSVHIPASVREMDDFDAFYECPSLVSVTVDPENRFYASEAGLLYNKNMTELIGCPQGIQGAVELPDSVTTILGEAFERCFNLTAITIPASVKILDFSAFWECTGLTGIYFKGDAPVVEYREAVPSATNAVVYYLVGATGFGPEIAGYPTALWVVEPGPEPAPESDLSDPESALNIAPVAPAAYDGFVYDADGVVRGTFTLSVKKNGAGSMKVLLQGATISFSVKGWSGAEGIWNITARGGESLALHMGLDRCAGELVGGKVGGSLSVDGSRRIFADKKDVAAQTQLSAVRGLYNVALIADGDIHAPSSAGYLTLNVGNAGAVKIAGKLADGTSVSGSAKLMEGLNADGWYAIALHKPLYSKKGFVGGLLWLDPRDKVLRVDVGSGWFMEWVCEDTRKIPFAYELDVCGGYFGSFGLPPALTFGASLPEGLPPPVANLDGAWMETAFPWTLPVTVSGARLALPKASAPKKLEGIYDYDTANPSAAKITYTAKTGLFKGSFKMYYDGLNARGALAHKAVNVSYAGVMIPSRDTAYAGWPIGLGTGTATVNRQKTGIPVYLWRD